MALRLPEQIEESLKKSKLRVLMNGGRVESVLENRNTKAVVEANKANYAWALAPDIKTL